MSVNSRIIIAAILLVVGAAGYWYDITLYHSAGLMGGSSGSLTITTSWLTIPCFVVSFILFLSARRKKH